MDASTPAIPRFKKDFRLPSAVNVLPGYNKFMVLIRMKRTYPDTLLVVNSVYRKHDDTRYLNGKYGDDSLYIRLHLQRKYFLRK